MFQFKEGKLFEKTPFTNPAKNQHYVLKIAYIFYTKCLAFAALVKYLLPKMFPIVNFQFQNYN